MAAAPCSIALGGGLRCGGGSGSGGGGGEQTARKLARWGDLRKVKEMTLCTSLVVLRP